MLWWEIAAAIVSRSDELLLAWTAVLGLAGLAVTLRRDVT